MSFSSESWTEIDGVRVAPGATWSQPADFSLRIVVTCTSVKPDRFKPSLVWHNHTLCDGAEVGSDNEAFTAGRELIADALRRLFGEA